jgi:DNA polymerase elongation subunit (family B)
MYSQGWLFDVYPAQATMVVWLYQEDGRLLRLDDPFCPRLYARGRPNDLRTLARATLRTRVCSRCTLTRQREFWSGERVTVLALDVADYGMFPRLLQRLSEFESRITFYNCDLPLPQYYLYCRELFPFGQCEVEHDGRTIARIRACEPNTALHYAMPSLRILELQLTQDPLIPLQRGNTLQVTLDGRSYEYTTNDSVELLDQLNTCLIRYDPDLILTDYGDTAIFPALLQLARRHRMPLALDREPTPIERRLVTEGRSFFTYGKMLYYPPAYPLYGRWHIDRAHSFLYHETGFAGIIELARLAKLPMQRAARASIGTILTSMQLDVAVQRHLLIPWRKGEPERWKTADVLLKVDKGGLVFQPPVGAFEDVAELDFSAMYPAIMVQHNISAETLFCRCCDNHVVPEAGYTICERHEGLAAAMLRPLIKRRAYYKARVKEGGVTAEEALLYDQRQRAHKWIGVTCLDGHTTVLHRRNGRWKISPIRDVVEGYLPASQWGQRSVDDLAVLGVDAHLQHCLKRVQFVLKVPAPATMLRIKLRWGRETLVTPDHPCYILQHGCLEVQRADALTPGDWVPIGVSLAGACEGNVTEVHLARLLTLDELGTLSMGWGKRESGMIQRLPSRVQEDLGFLRRWARPLSTLLQVPAVDSGLWDLCKAARVLRVPRISGVEMVAKATANGKLHQVSRRIRRLNERLIQQLERIRELVQSSLAFAQVVAVERVRAAHPFVYCFQLAEEPAAFFIEGGVLTHNCFGYLGYRNARFGRIESHEAVTAFGREKLLQAKEICEAHGYELLHALTDSLWLRKAGLAGEELMGLCRKITDATGITMDLEGRYRWIVFLPSKVRPQLAVANRYFGVFWDGTLKARGLAYRRHDVPVFIQVTQRAMLEVLAEAENLAAYVARVPKALEVLRDVWEQLATGHIPPLQLLVAKTVSQELEAYRVENATAQALRQLRAVGIDLHPGERVHYLIRDARAPNKEERVRAFPRLGPDDGFDVAQYQAMLLDAALELLAPFGYDEAQLRQAMA